VILIALYNGWHVETIDIEAAFLEGDIEEPAYMEWPPGMLELGQIDADKRPTNCLQLNKNIYGMVDAALIFYKAYAKQLMKEMKMERSKSDACLFVKHDQAGKVTLVTSCHVDDTLVAGTKESIAEFKAQLSERFKLEEMGIMTKHLGIK